MLRLEKLENDYGVKITCQVETKYLDDAGQSENVFNLSPDELRNRAVG
jgi:hypothetical protein